MFLRNLNWLGVMSRFCVICDNPSWSQPVLRDLWWFWWSESIPHHLWYFSVIWASSAWSKPIQRCLSWFCMISDGSARSEPILGDLWWFCVFGAGFCVIYNGSAYKLFGCSKAERASIHGLQRLVLPLYRSVIYLLNIICNFLVETYKYFQKKHFSSRTNPSQDVCPKLPPRCRQAISWPTEPRVSAYRPCKLFLGTCKWVWTGGTPSLYPKDPHV